MKKLYIIDLSKHYLDIKIENCNVIYINIGNVSQKNIKKIKINNLKLNNFARKKLVGTLNKKIVSKNDYFLNELELFNIRNDKNFAISKILNLIKVKSFIKEKDYELCCISDNEFTVKLLNQFSKKKIVNEFKGKTAKKSFAKKNYFLYFFKFLIKTYFILVFIKFFNQKKLMKSAKLINKPWSLSLFPNFYQENKEKFFGKNYNKVNFLLTDESHLNYSFSKILNVYFTNRKKILNIESFISFKDIFTCFKNGFIKKKLYHKILNEKLIIDNLDFSTFYQETIMSSFINRSKLMIYDNAIIKFQNYFQFKEFHTYLFEYNFGFYIIRNLKLVDCKIVGYQHGIFNKNVMWLDIITQNNYKIYYPTKIISNFKSSLNEYKRKYKNSFISFKYQKKRISKLAYILKPKKNNKNNKKILILSGTHDIKDIYLFCKNEINKTNDYTYYIKTHPKNRFNFSNERKLKKINSIKSRVYDKILVSSTSTVAYDLELLNTKFDIFKPDYKSI
tara:strand:+ start:12153 stop:13667 length:1515 start_codon:yes stop_codon:yes gene_type:complete